MYSATQAVTQASYSIPSPSGEHLELQEKNSKLQKEQKKAWEALKSEEQQAWRELEQKIQPHHQLFQTVLSTSPITDPCKYIVNLLGKGSYGFVRSFTPPEVPEDRLFVIKISYAPPHYCKHGATQEWAKELSAKSKKNIEHEVNILSSIHSQSKSGEPFTGIELPPYRIVKFNENDPDQTQVGYIGVRYDQDLFSEIVDEPKTSERNKSSKEKVIIYKSLEDRKFYSPQLAGQLFYGLATLYRLSILHGDIKPENILIRERNRSIRVDLADFGTAQTKEVLEQIWNETRPQIDKLSEDLQAKLKELKSCSWDTDRQQKAVQQKYHADLNKLTEKVIRAFGSRTVTEEMLNKEFTLIREGTFEDWYKAAQRRDLYSVAFTVRLMMQETASLSSVQKELLEKALNYKAFPAYTIAEMADAWNQSLTAGSEQQQQQQQSASASSNKQ